MKHKIFVRIICVVLAFSFVTSVALVAISALTAQAVVTDNVSSVGASIKAGAEGYISDDYVNLRSGAGTSYSVVACMIKNTKIIFTDGKLYNSAWYKIKLTNGKSGYVYKDYVKISSTAAASASTTTSSSLTGYVSSDYVNLRSGAGTSYSVVTCMRVNTKFTFVSTSLYNSSWYKIKLTDGKTGYVHKDYIKKNASSTTSPNATTNTTPATSSSVTGYVSSDYVNLRSGAGSSYSVIACMRVNTKFTFVSTSLYNSSWYKIKLTDGKTGYVHKDYVKKNTTTNATSPSVTSVTGYVSSDYVNLRSGAGSSYSVITCMRVNTKFTFVSTSLYNSSWYKIKLTDGKTGYVHKDYIKKDAMANPSQPVTQPTTQPVTQPTDPTTASSSIKLSVSSKTVYAGNLYAITATSSGSVSWSSSNTAVATVSDGVVTAKSSGTAIITAKSGAESATCKITVKSGNSVNISNTSATVPLNKSIRLSSQTSGVTWSSSDTSIATVTNGIVDTKSKGKVTITASTSAGAATCLINVVSRDSIRFCYASPNSAPLNSTVTFKAITDLDRVDVRFVVTNGTTSYTVNADKKVKDGNTYIWTGSKVLTKSGKWSIKAYSKFKTETKYYTTDKNGEGEVFVTSTTDKKTTVCSERRASDEIIGLIANYEGFLSSVTADYITSDPTLGYGKVVWSGEQFYNNITKNEAYAYLCQTVNSGGYTTRTNAYLIDNKIKFNQQQFDALVCFCYNVGSGVYYNDSVIQSVLLNTTGSSGTITENKSGYVNSDGVNLRSGAGTNYTVLKCMPINTKFTFVDGKIYNTNWYKIKLTDGTVGYIYKTYASLSGGTRDLNNVNKQNYLNAFLQYHHAAGSCYWGLLYRRIDEAEVFFIADYDRDGQYNYNKYSFVCASNSNFRI